MCVFQSAGTAGTAADLEPMSKGPFRPFPFPIGWQAIGQSGRPRVNSRERERDGRCTHTHTHTHIRKKTKENREVAKLEWPQPPILGSTATTTTATTARAAAAANHKRPIKDGAISIRRSFGRPISDQHPFVLFFVVVVAGFSTEKKRNQSKTREMAEGTEMNSKETARKIWK